MLKRLSVPRITGPEFAMIALLLAILAIRVVTGT
jgi:hypothetical protein